ncbi:MAG: EAL domain-containing protein [Rhodospirillaceae bacterium]|jgi:diguanylate cyclase|nr:EAL domain-containing protein [Rhodospirillaceae bacterium]
MTTASTIAADGFSAETDRKADRGPVDSVDSARLRILLACNDKADRDRIARLLAASLHADYRLDWAEGYGTAIQAIGEASHDLLLLDDRLDGGTGVNLLREARETCCAMPIILLTRTEAPETERWAIEAGAADCLVRPRLSAPLLDRAVRFAVARRESSDRIRYLSQYDPLTGLANRVLFRDRLNRAIGQARQGEGGLVLMLLALDRFALVNETMGPTAGEQLLRSAAERLFTCLGGTASLARVGHDEFGVLLEHDTSPEEATLVAERIGRAMRPPFELNGHEVLVTTSIGIAGYPHCGWNADTLMNSASTALYQAKERGRNSYQFYTRKMTARELQRLVLQTSLHRALDRNEFALHYQAQIDLRSGRLAGTEALLRWQHPEFGLLGPDQFIPIAEETGLIVPIGHWVLATACLQARAWAGDGQHVPRMAVNLSARQFREPGLPATIGRILNDAELPADRLALEMTESMLMEDTEGASAVLASFRDMGLHVAIDDFGTGYSSLSYLKRFPLDTLKIDKSFVRDVTTDPDDAAIATAVIGLAHNLRLGVIAEGVETEAQLDFLRTHGCDVMQGFLYSPPLPPGDFEKLLAACKPAPVG